MRRAIGSSACKMQKTLSTLFFSDRCPCDECARVMSLSLVHCGLTAHRKCAHADVRDSPLHLLPLCSSPQRDDRAASSCPFAHVGLPTWTPSANLASSSPDHHSIASSLTLVRRCPRLGMARLTKELIEKDGQQSQKSAFQRLFKKGKTHPGTASEADTMSHMVRSKASGRLAACHAMHCPVSAYLLTQALGSE